MRRTAILIVIAAAAAALVAVAAPAVGIAATVVTVLAGGWVMRRPLAGRLAGDEDRAPSVVRAASEGAAPLEWLEAMPLGVLLLDDDLVVVAVNEAAVSLCGRPRSEIEGGSLIRAIRDHNITEIARERAGVPREVDVRDGQVVRATATRLDQPIGRARHILALEDLTALRHAQRARSDLVANASHELRTPVTAALALAETLESGVEDEDRRHGFHVRLSQEVLRLSEIVEGLLVLSRLESRSDEFVVEPLRPRELLETAARRIEPLLTTGQSIEIPEASDASVDGDRDRVLEVLANLLDNALRVSPDRGTVTLAAFGGEDEVRFEVRDEGPGILPRDRPRIFERFYTGDDSRTASSNNGLGLAIARHIVSRLGGRIWVGDRTPGATLCFTLPLAETPAPGRDDSVREAGIEASRFGPDGQERRTTSSLESCSE
jgi:two-component system phosphate regulon sensor histidine kinase PhoR